PYRDVIGADLPGYRNHVLRVLSYAMHFLDQEEALRPTVETALAYHDIGLWTDLELAYLEPSERRLQEDAARLGEEVHVELAVRMIHWHHKVTRYRGPDARAVDAVRRADWVDATQGKLRKGLSKAQVHAVEAAIPNEGFHDTLQRLAREYGGSTLRGNLRVLRSVFKW
ncbi:MAG: phosphohydrolase, partial [Planctomycetota bacterium]